MSDTYLSLWRGPLARPGERIRDALQRASDRHGVSIDEIKGDSRKRKITRARHEACWRLRQIEKNGKPALSFPRIAQIIGRQDHTSIMHACQQHERRNGL